MQTISESTTVFETNTETTIVIESVSDIQQKYIPMTDLNNQSRSDDKVCIHIHH